MNALILVVDDEADVESLFRQQFRRDLRAGRFEMAFATRATDAIAALETAGDRRVILLLSDVNMPGMSGLDLLAHVRATLPDLPVILITAYGDGALKERARAAGAREVLGKPVDFAALRAEIEARLSTVGA